MSPDSQAAATWIRRTRRPTRLCRCRWRRGVGDVDADATFAERRMAAGSRSRCCGAREVRRQSQLADGMFQDPTRRRRGSHSHGRGLRLRRPGRTEARLWRAAAEKFRDTSSSATFTRVGGVRVADGPQPSYAFGLHPSARRRQSHHRISARAPVAVTIVGGAVVGGLGRTFHTGFHFDVDRTGSIPARVARFIRAILGERRLNFERAGPIFGGITVALRPSIAPRCRSS